MSSVISRDGNEIEFREPLSPTPTKTLLAMTGSNHSLPSLSCSSKPRGRVSISAPVPQASFGLMGPLGAFVSLAVFFFSLGSDVLLLFALGRQAEDEHYFYRRKEEWNWFAITFTLIIVPQVIINTLSLLWYTQNKKVLGKYRIFHRKSPLGRVSCVFFHLLLLGQVTRYLDMIRLHKLARRHTIRLNMGSRGSLHRLSSKGDPSAIYQLNVLSKDTALLDLMRAFFQDAPQLIFQIFLLYRSTTKVPESSKDVDLVLPAQLIKILLGLFAISWSLVTYQDEVRRSIPGNRQLTCGATNACLIWRVCMAGSRILAIASFAALEVNGEGGLVKVYSDNAPSGAVLSFPSIAALVIFCHWFLMVIWIHAQKTTFCITTEGGTRPLLEFFYNLFMGYVHVFCYVNVKETPSRRRIFFFYVLVFMENTSFMVVWYMQLITKYVWLRVTVVFSVEALFVTGISCAIGYYAFLHPQQDRSRTSSVSSRRS